MHWANSDHPLWYFWTPLSKVLRKEKNSMVLSAGVTTRLGFFELNLNFRVDPVVSWYQDLSSSLAGKLKQVSGYSWNCGCLLLGFLRSKWSSKISPISGVPPRHKWVALVQLKFVLYFNKVLLYVMLSFGKINQKLLLFELKVEKAIQILEMNQPPIQSITELNHRYTR